MVGLRIIRVDFDRIDEFDCGLGVIALFKVPLATLEIFLPESLRVAGA
jgi:hypothetical protein